jgi:hypothetical protein
MHSFMESSRDHADHTQPSKLNDLWVKRNVPLTKMPLIPKFRIVCARRHLRPADAYCALNNNILNIQRQRQPPLILTRSSQPPARLSPCLRRLRDSVVLRLPAFRQRQRQDRT